MLTRLQKQQQADMTKHEKFHEYVAKEMGLTQEQVYELAMDLLAKELHIRSTKYITAPTGITYYVDNLTQFCKEHGLHRYNLSLVLKGERNHHKGYTRTHKPV